MAGKLVAAWLVTALPLISRARPDLLSSRSYFVVEDAEGRIFGAGGWTAHSPAARGGKVQAGLARSGKRKTGARGPGCDAGAGSGGSRRRIVLDRRRTAIATEPGTFDGITSPLICV